MKKAKSSHRASSMKRSAAKNVDEYLAAVPEPARTTLNTIRAVIRSAVPHETTEAITYGIPTFKYKGSLLAFAAFKNDLKPFLASKGTIRYPLDKPLPSALVKKLVKARIAEKDRKK